MQSRNTNLRAWIIWGLAAAFFFSEYFATVAPSVMVPNLMTSFKVGAFSLGSLSAIFYYAYVGMQLPVGALVDRFGPRLLLSLMAAICGLSSLLFAHSQVLFSAQVSRFFMGFSAAFAFVGALKLASVWFPRSKFGFLAGTTQALGMLGAAVGEGPVSVLVYNFGWRYTMNIIGIVLLIISVLIALIVRDSKNGIHTNKKPIEHKDYGIIAGLIEVLKNPATWVNGVFVGFLYAPTVAFAELWGATYLHKVYHFNTEIAASAISMIFIGWAISSPLAGFLSDKIKRRKPVMFMSACLSLIFLSAVLYAPNLPMFLVFLFLLLYGASNVGVATSYAVACEINPHKIAGTSMSFANMSSVIIGAAFQPIIGLFLDLLWSGHYLDGHKYYSASDFHIAMLAVPACFIISIIALMFIKESYKNH